MTAIIPTASSIKARFPEFASQSDTVIEFAIEEARVAAEGGNFVDYVNETLALTYLTAHYLMVSISRAESGTGQRIKSENFGPMSVTYDTDAGGPLDPSDFQSTPYGQRYAELIRNNFPAILVV